jgi:hypothetical protein
MIPHEEFYRRRDEFCAPCEHWRGVCLRGHKLSSPQGCPLQKFPPILGADYAVDMQPRTESAPGAPGGCCGSGAADELKPLSWGQAIQHLQDSLEQWNREGRKLTPEKDYLGRVDKCQTNQCGHYKWFQCRLCKCFVFAKAKLPHESCPAGLWSSVATT